MTGSICHISRDSSVMLKRNFSTGMLFGICAALLLASLCAGNCAGQTSAERILIAEEYNRQLHADLVTLAAQIKRNDYGKYFVRVELGIDTITSITPNPKRWRRLTAEKQVLIVKDWWYLWRALRQPHEDKSFTLQLFTSGVKRRVDCFGSINGEPFCTN